MRCFDAVVIATDALEVLEVARGFGALAELTASGHPSGTDRIAEVVERPRYRGFEVVANVQGDEPFVTEEQVHGALAAVQSGGWLAGTVAAPIGSAAEWRDPAVVKVVRDDAGAALLFSRAPVPHSRDGEPDFATGMFLRHVGIYAYARDALLRWVSLPEHPLERVERLEQLRPLAAGIRIGVATVAHADGGVDTPEDAVRADRRLREVEP
jgi:3-deoxy-manno-octulosonate cytidylyltransferase (CMP-KDO synthetase)